MLKVNQKTIENILNSCVDIAAFAGVGNLSGRVVNEYVHWTTMPSIFKKAITIDLTSASICCGLFAAFDRITHSALNSLVGIKKTNHPFYSTLRIGGCAMGAAQLFNKVASHINLTKIENKPAVAVILTAVVIYTQISSILTCFNARQ